MVKIAAEPSSIRKDVPMGNVSRRVGRNMLGHGIADVLDAAFTPSSHADMRRSILTVVYNYDTEAFEIRWDLAK